MIDRITDPDTPWLKILCEYGFCNKPFILESWSTSSWEARKKWVNENGKPNVEYLKEHYGSSEVPVLVTGLDYKTTVFSEYIANLGNSDQYLKDWHFQKEYGIKMYSLHPFFSRDFVNCESWTNDLSLNPFGDDYRFFYFGCENSWTKFHSDVISSHSWSANICGRKLWYMMAPGKEESFKASTGFVDDIREKEDFHEEAKVIKFIQEPGEIVFVPSNWYHQVHNLTDTISINHNWINSTNIGHVHEFLSRRKLDVLKELEDCRQYFDEKEFNEKVELVLFADARLNKSKFQKLCTMIIKSRQEDREPWKCEIHNTEMSDSEYMKKMTNNSDFKNINEKELVKIFESVRDRKRLEQRDFDQIQVEKIRLYGELFKACNLSNSNDPILRCEELDEQIKNLMVDVLTKNSNLNTKEEKIEWNVNIIVGNSHVTKSLQPIVNIQMPTSNGKTLEFDLDSFAQFRLSIANAIRATVPEK